MLNLAEQQSKLNDDLCIEEEEVAEKDVLLTKMHKSLKILVNKSADKYDEVEVDEVVDDIEMDEVLSQTSKMFLEVNELVDTESRVKNIEQIRTKALDKLKDQAQTMLNRNKKAINALNVDDIVLYKADDVDLGASDAPNIVCIILDKNDSMFRLGHKGGILKEWFPFNVLQKIDGVAMNFTKDDVPIDKEISVREAIKFVSIAGGQGYKACNCKTGKCGKGTKCTCFRDGVKCNSRCHKGENNKNCTNKIDKKK